MKIRINKSACVGNARRWAISEDLSSLGHIGGTGFTPIINAPEAAILGIWRTQSRLLPDANGNAVVRQLLPLSLSYNHRVINGADAARFVCVIRESLDAFEFQ